MEFRFLISAVLLVSFQGGCMAEKKSFRESYATPEETFRSWKQSVIKLDLAGVVRAYAVEAQPQMQKEIAATPQEALKAMQKETEATEFKIEKIVYENNRAYLRVARKIEKETEIEVLTMMKEGSGWKLLP